MKILSLILSAVLVLCLLGGCASPKSDSVESTKESTAPKKENVNPTGESYADGVVLEVHLYSLCKYFYSDYDAKTDTEKTDLLHSAAEFLFIQRPNTVALVENTDGAFSVSGETLENTMRLLFGKDLSLDSYRSYLNAELGDSYNSETDTYSFVYSEEKWYTGKYIPLFDREIEFNETAESITAKLYVTDTEGKELCLNYSFTKIVDDNYLYFTLDSVRVG